MRFNPRPLITAVKAAMPLPRLVHGSGTQRSWSRPPLVNPHKLNGVNLQEYTKVVPSFPTEGDDFIDIAERFLDTFLLCKGAPDTPLHPSDWVRGEIEITEESAHWLLPNSARPCNRETLWRMYATILWLGGNADGIFQFDKNNILYTCGPYSVGVQDGRLVSPSSRLRGVEVQGIDWHEFFTGPHPGGATRCKLTAWNRMMREAQRLPDPNTSAAVQSALQILQARVRKKRYLVEAFYPRKAGPRSREQRLRAVVDSLQDHPDPYRRLKEYLVPDWISAVAFSRLVNKQHPGRPSAQTLAGWADNLYGYFDLYDV